MRKKSGGHQQKEKHLGRISQLSLALIIMVLSVGSITVGDSAGKFLGFSLGVAPLFIAWTRFGVGALLIIPFVNWHTFSFKMLLDWRVILRALLIVGGIVSILSALKTTSMASVFGAFFIGPIVAYFLAAWLLKETISLARSILLLMGFFGVMLVIKPSFDMDIGLGLALLAGALYGGFVVASRWLADVAPASTLLFSQLIIGAVVLLPFGLAEIPKFSWLVMGLVAASALFSLLGNLSLIQALKMAETNVLAPMIYLQLVFATLFGYIIFGEIPDMQTLIGLGVVLVSGLAALVLVAKVNRAN